MTSPTASVLPSPALDDGPTFLKSIGWMMLTLSLLTMGIGGLFYKADQAHAPSLAAAAQAQVR